MSRKEENRFVPPPFKKLRFRGDSGSQLDGKIEDIFDDDSRRMSGGSETNSPAAKFRTSDTVPIARSVPSLYDFVKVELTRGYLPEHDEERYSARREKIYTFMRIPRELEKFMVYGVLQCADSFLYIYTFLPIRYVLALWALMYRPVACCLGLRRRTQRLLTPAEICDLLKGSIWMFCTLIMLYVDTNRFYHVIKSQSIIKLYIFYNMLEVGDRLLSAFGQDTIDALFWTATEPRNSRRAHFGLLTHILFTLIYVGLHSLLIMFQATTLNVAVNSSNKGLLTIMMSNNFVELKGSVFKKFDKNNLYQLTCSDVRERFHLTVLLFIVVIQTMKEFSWRSDQLYVMLPDCVYVLLTEVAVDWIKHAFITRFNELPVDVYKEYTLSLAYDMTQTRQKHAFSDHSDLVARRMGFIPFPLGVVLIKALYHALSFDNAAAILLALGAYAVLMSCRVVNVVYALGKACDLMNQHRDEKSQSHPASSGMHGVFPLQTTPATSTGARQRTDSATSPLHMSSATPLQRSHTVDTVPEAMSVSSSSQPVSSSVAGLLQATPTLAATALFSNSDVDLDDVFLNENILACGATETIGDAGEFVTRSVPDLQQETSVTSTGEGVPGDESAPVETAHRTHKRSESEPSIQSAHLGEPGVERGGGGGGGGGG